MSRRHFLLKGLFSYIITVSTAADASSIIWVAQGSSSDMNTPENWTPGTIPGSSDDAIFDSSVSGIDTNPTEDSASFSVSNINFPHSASAFNFNFNNATLTFNGTGITGNNTNAAFDIVNLNNSSFLGTLVSFLGSPSTSGSASITSFNNATLTGNQSGTAIGIITSNFYSSGPFALDNGGQISANNIGNDSTNGAGSNAVATTGDSQLRFDQSFTAGNNVAVSLSNSGAFSGTNTSQGNAVSIINGSQFLSSGAFLVGDNFSCQVENTGNDSCTGVGLSNIGQINAAQMLLQTTGTAGNGSIINISNTGINSSQTTGFPDYIGYLNDEQFFVGGTFQAENDFSLAVSNSGTDSSSGYGSAQVAVINSNSGTSGHQILLAQGSTLGDRASISVGNFGAYSGTNTNGGSNVAGMNLAQIAIGDADSPGSYAFNAGNDFTLAASSVGTDSAHGIGADAVGNVSTDQIVFYTPCSLGHDAQIQATKSGEFSGQASTTYVNVGSAGGCQLNCESTLQTGDNFQLAISNTGTHSGSGAGNNFIGDLIVGQQARFSQAALIGNNATISIANSGSNSSNTTSNNQVGSLMGYGKQLWLKESLNVGNNLILAITNSGFDDSAGAGGNYVGFLNNNTVDQTGSQLHLDAGGTLGNLASISLSNAGTYQGNNTGAGNVIGTLSGQQFYSISDFQTGDDFSLAASNSGTDNASGQSSHTIGVVGSGGQIQFGNECILGNNAAIDLINSGTNHDTTGTLNTIGYVNGSQFQVGGNFSAGTNLEIQAYNTAANSGDISNAVGYINGSQLLFQQSCILNDSSSINAYNTGTIANSQIVFAQGFEILSGKATIQAVNNGTVGSFGIDIQGSNAGGNADILLSNSSLHIETTLPTFAIASLNGDSTSVVQSKPTLTINTDPSTYTDFAGSIEDFPSLVSSLTKTGPGTQKLSGENTYTGLTKIQEGTLIVSGSLAGAVDVTGSGLLKGSGSIAGDITNSAKIAPGESIGTLTFLSDFINNGGGYDVEVNGAGQSDLILVGGNALLNGGVVGVSSDDGAYLFQQNYTIMDVAGSITGQFAGVITPTPLINAILSYDTHHVFLNLFTNIARAATSSNQLAVALQLDGIDNPTPQQTLLLNQMVGLTLEEASEALFSLSGYQHTSDFLVTEMIHRQFVRRLYDPLRDIISPGEICDDCDYRTNSDPVKAWIEVENSYLSAKGNDNAHGFNVDGYNIVGGIQTTFRDVWTLGIAGEYENHEIRYDINEGKEHSNTWLVGLYGLYRPSGLYTLADLVYGQSDNKLNRSIDVGTSHYRAKSAPDTYQYTFYGELGTDCSFCDVLIQPFCGIEAGAYHRRQVKESDANGWGLMIKEKHHSYASTRIGVHLTTQIPCLNNGGLSVDIAWNRFVNRLKNRAQGQFIDFGTTFDIDGIKLNQNSIDYALTLSSQINENCNVYIEGSGESWKHLNQFTMTLGINTGW